MGAESVLRESGTREVDGPDGAGACSGDDVIGGLTIVVRIGAEPVPREIGAEDGASAAVGSETAPEGGASGMGPLASFGAGPIGAGKIGSGTAAEGGAIDSGVAADGTVGVRKAPAGAAPMGARTAGGGTAGGAPALLKVGGALAAELAVERRAIGGS
jgi:hypothetical protein